VASNALYSEVIELVLSIDKYKAAVLESHDYMQRLITETKQPIPIIANASKYIAEIDAAIRYEKELEAQVERTNHVIRSRREAYAAVANKERTEAVGVRKDTGAFLGAQSAARSQINLAAEQQELDLLLKQAAARWESVQAERALAALLQKTIAQEKAVAAAAAKRIQSTMGYKVGNFAMGTRVGAGLDIAAGAGFALGGTNLGASIYMLERFAYASGIGQKSLGELAQKFGLVKDASEDGGASIMRFGSNIMKFIGGAAVVAGVTALAAAGRELNRELAVMSTLLAPVGTGVQQLGYMIDKAGNAAGRLSGAFNISQVEVVKGFYDALSTGIDASQLEQFGTVAATVARGLNTSFASSISILTTLKDAYGASVGDMTRYSDILFNAIDVGKFNVKDLQSNLGRVAVTAAAAGVSIEDMMGALAGLNRAGLSTSQSVTALNRYITAIIKPTDTAKKEMEQLGIQFGAAAFKGRAFAAQIEELRSLTGGDIDVISRVAGTEQGRRGAVITTALPGLMYETRDAINATGSAAEAANRVMNTFGENFGKIFKDIGNSVAQAGSDLLNIFNAIVFGTAKTDKSLISFKTLLDGVLFAINTVIAGVGTVIIVLRGALELLGNILRTVSLTLTGQWDAATAAFDKLTSDVGKRGDQIGNMWSRLANAYTDRILGGAEATNTALNRISDKTEELAKELPSVFTDALVKMLDTVEKKTTTIFAKIANELRNARFEAEKLAFSQTYKRKSTDASEPTATAPNEQEAAILARMQRGRELRVKYPENTWSKSPYADSYKSFMQTQMSAVGALDPEDPDVRKVFDIIQDNRLKRGKADAESLAKTEAEAYKAAYLKHMTEIGFGKEVTTEISVGTKVLGSADLPAFEQLFGMLDKLSEKKIVAVTPEDIAAVKTRIAELIEWYAGEKHKLTAAERTNVENMLRIATEGLEQVTDKHNKEIAVRQKAVTNAYEAEYDAYHKVWQDKMKLYDAEIEKAKTLQKMAEDSAAKMRDYIKELRRQSRNDPVFERRQIQSEIIERVSKFGGITDTTKATDEADKLLELIKQFRQLYESEGHGRRAASMAEEFVIQIEEAQKRNAAKHASEVTDWTTKGVAATTKFNAETADIATRSQLIPMVNEALRLAAKNGIGVNGDLLSEVQIGTIKVDGLQAADVVRVVQKEMKALLNSVLRDLDSGRRPSVGDNNGPVGAPPPSTGGGDDDYTEWSTANSGPATNNTL
jgi:TP901 family phage tail tape measure protein